MNLGFLVEMGEDDCTLLPLEFDDGGFEVFRQVRVHDLGVSKLGARLSPRESTSGRPSSRDRLDQERWNVVDRISDGADSRTGFVAIADLRNVEAVREQPRPNRVDI